MAINEIEHYLSECRIKLDKSVNNEIIRALKDAVNRSNEEEANYLWCLRNVVKAVTNPVTTEPIITP